MVLPIFLNLFGLGTWHERLIAVARWPFLLVGVTAALSLIYRYGPSRRVAKWRWVTGSLTAAVLWLLMSMLFSWYVTHFDSYNRVYGSLGAVVGFMTWMWFSVVVVLVGAELNAEMELQTSVDSTAGPPRPRGTAAPSSLIPLEKRKTNRPTFGSPGFVARERSRKIRDARWRGSPIRPGGGGAIDGQAIQGLPKRLQPRHGLRAPICSALPRNRTYPRNVS